MPDVRQLLRAQARKQGVRLDIEVARLWGEAEAAGVTVTASGERSVAIGGNVSGSVIITDDNNRVR